MAHGSVVLLDPHTPVPSDGPAHDRNYTQYRLVTSFRLASSQHRYLEPRKVQPPRREQLAFARLKLLRARTYCNQCCPSVRLLLRTIVRAWRGTLAAFGFGLVRQLYATYLTKRQTLYKPSSPLPNSLLIPNTRFRSLPPTRLRHPTMPLPPPQSHLPSPQFQQQPRPNRIANPSIDLRVQELPPVIFILSDVLSHF